VTGSKISYNIHAQMVKDSTRLKNHLLKIQPAAVLAMDGLGLAQEIKAALPNTLVIHRNYGITNGDDDIHKRVSPEKWLDLRAKESDGGIYLYTTNEPGFSQDCLDWHVHLMELAAARSVRLVIGNFGVGTPGADDWGRAQRMLELLDQHRELFILGLHEYACGIITSGLYGGYPDNAGVQPGTPGGQNLIPKDKWPADVSTVTMFHMGRFNFLLTYCKLHGLNPPRIILTEHGMDDVSDIKPWAEKLDKTSPYLNIRGWKSLHNQWNTWFNPVGWSAERAYLEQLAWADRVIYHNSPVEAQLVYCWAHSSEDWEQFDVAEASEFQSLLEAYAAEKVVDVSPKTATSTQNIVATGVPKPENAGAGTKVTVLIRGQYKNLRSGPGTNYTDDGDINNGEALTIFYATARPDSTGGKWAWIEGAHDGAGWMSIDGVIFTNVPTKPIPVVTQPPGAPPNPDLPPDVPKPPAPVPVPTLPEDSTPLTIIPSVREFRYTMQIVVRAETEVAAEKVAEFSLASARNAWLQFVEIAKLQNDLSAIKDASFVIELPQEVKP
jgi:hypothetical protein